MKHAYMIANEEHLVPYQKNLLDEIRIIVEDIVRDSIENQDFFCIKKEGEQYVLEVLIIPTDKHFPALGLTASPEHCILSIAEGELIECHHDAGSTHGLVEMVLEATRKYLMGVTVVEHYDKKGRLIRRSYYYGIDTENDESARIASSTYHIFPRKASKTEKYSFRFLLSNKENHC